ncbi:MAG: hypothetical protein HY561_07905 [Gemmatimonadetes bacterium]|nr:hypothetical protein [Gemmatimonadota bacterium]
MPQYFIGIDGGATRATALVTDETGRELARLGGGAGIVKAASPAAGAQALASLAAKALSAAGAASPAAGLCCALAGAGREPERDAMRTALYAAGVARRVSVVTDAEAAIQDALGTGPGILIIAGTGSIGWGRGDDGQTVRVGGWGELLGDEGSGYAIGLAGLRAAARAVDGRGPATPLLEQLLAETKVKAPEGLIAWVEQASKADVAALAPRVLAAASQGDEVARALGAQAARDLVDHAAALHRRLSPWREAPLVALAGGLLAPGRPLRVAVLQAVRSLPLAFRVLERDVDGARGAAALARSPR